MLMRGTNLPNTAPPAAPRNPHVSRHRWWAPLVAAAVVGLAAYLLALPVQAQPQPQPQPRAGLHIAHQKSASLWGLQPLATGATSAALQRGDFNDLPTPADMATASQKIAGRFDAHHPTHHPRQFRAAEVVGATQ